MSSNVAIITARAGSKRIPKKNIKLFLGKPIIAYSIRAAKEAQLFDEIMVSTDSEEIAEIAVQHGAVVPFFRSPKTSDDYSGTADVLVEVLTAYRTLNIYFDTACCLYPTAPFVKAERLNEGFTKLITTDASTVVPISEFASSVSGKHTPFNERRYSAFFRI